MSTPLPTNMASASLGTLATGFWASRAIYVAAKIGVVDLLARGPRSVDFLAETIECDKDALYRLLRALSTTGLFIDRSNGVFELTELGQILGSDVEGSMRNYVMMLGRPESWRAWEHLEQSIMTGVPAFQHEYQMPLFQYLAAHPPIARVFDEGMRSRGVADDDAIAKAYDFSAFNRIIDVGGGAGRLLSTILKSTPRARGVLFDLPHVVEGSRNSIVELGTGQRIECVGGDFFAAIPAAGDLYLLKQVIHDWSDEQAAEILGNCRSAMNKASKLLIFEVILAPESAYPKMLDLMMLVWTGGRERTEEEYEQLLTGAGLKLTRIVPTGTAISVLEVARSDAV
ncbi:methyltransferase [Rhodoplanes sp. Z2-YC6860]|uniref:methyltransferase n=1 Tax=Rhodoplanes sp. Z2-YC6860 TaxID=674703 RepID=UPI00078E6834|nr:methyltransferase [Rhodoplanes sp. Z2-YC6860]AMN43679.1 hydroxyneurosporene-O-methyltransferase [Rhodoplanes sp. Z2-YC6860]